MGSLDAENVAKEVVETLGKGEKVILGKIIKKHGYANETAKNPKNITETKSYKNIIEPVVKRLERERDRVIQAMTEKDLDKVSYDRLADVLDKITKNHQLLSGGKTESNEIKITWDK